METFEEYFENIANDDKEPSGWNHRTALDFNEEENALKKPDKPVLSYERFVKETKKKDWDRSKMLDGGGDEFDEDKE